MQRRRKVFHSGLAPGLVIFVGLHEKRLYMVATVASVGAFCRIQDGRIPTIQHVDTELVPFDAVYRIDAIRRGGTRIIARRIGPTAEKTFAVGH